MVIYTHPLAKPLISGQVSLWSGRDLLYHIWSYSPIVFACKETQYRAVFLDKVPLRRSIGGREGGREGRREEGRDGEREGGTERGGVSEGTCTYLREVSFTQMHTHTASACTHTHTLTQSFVSVPHSSVHSHQPPSHLRWVQASPSYHHLV